MKLKYGNLEFSDLTWDEVEQLVTRFGAAGESESSSNGSATTTQSTTGSTAAGSSNTADRSILAKMIAAGESGVLTTVLGDLLGKRGRAIPSGIAQWSIRIGLSGSEDVLAVEPARPEGKRGWRIKASMMHLAQEIASAKK